MVYYQAAKAEMKSWLEDTKVSVGYELSMKAHRSPVGDGFQVAESMA